MASLGITSNDTTTSGPEPHQDKFCQLCEKKGKPKDTVGYCKDCMKYLCENCHSSHQHGKQTKHHVLFDWKSKTKSFKLTKPKPSKVDDVCTTRCDKHPEKVIEYICIEHDELGCSLCMVGGHKSCDSVKHVAQFSPSLDDSDDYKDILRDMVSMVLRSQTLVNEVNDTKARANNYSKEVTKDVKKFRHQLNDAIGVLESVLAEHTGKARQEDFDKLDVCINKYKDVCQEVEKLMSGLQVLRNNRQNCQLFVAMKLARASMEPLQYILRNPEETKCMLYKFQPEWETLDVVKNEAALGKLTTEAVQSTTSVKDKIKAFENPVTSSGTTQQLTSIPTSIITHAPITIDDVDSAILENNTADDVATDNGSEESSVKEMEDMETNEATDICVSSKTDSYPVSISSSVLLHDDNLVVIDMANWKVKLLDTQRNVLVQELSGQGSPWDVTNIGEDEVAITFPVLKRIMFFKYEFTLPTKPKKKSRRTLTSDREIVVRGYCYGITYTNEKLVVTCARDWLLGDGATKVEIMNMDGHVLQRIMSDDEGEKLFIDPRYVAVSDDAKTLYISDWGDDTVTSVHVETSDISTYGDITLRKPGKIIIDTNGSLYICGQNSNNVHRVAPDCTDLQVMFSGNGLVAPRSISVSEAQGTIYVGMIDYEFIRTYHVL